MDILVRRCFATDKNVHPTWKSGWSFEEISEEKSARTPWFSQYQEETVIARQRSERYGD
jgi:hypothetical protein